MNIPKKTGQVIVGKQNAALFVKVLRKQGISAGPLVESDIAGRAQFNFAPGSWESGVAQGVARALDEIAMLNTIKEADKNYFYYINLDERGEFYADVRDSKGETVFEIKGSEIFEDGFMKHKSDLRGLESYLKDLEVIPGDASVTWCTHEG